MRAAGHFHIRCASFDGAVGGVVRNQMSRRCTRGKPPSASFPLLPCPPSIRLRAPPVPRASWPSAIPPTDAALVGTFPLPRFPSSPSRCRQLAHPSRLTCFSAVSNIHSRRCSRGNPHVAMHIPVLLGRRQVPRLTLHSWELSPSPASPPLPSRRRQLAHPSRSSCFSAVCDVRGWRCDRGNRSRFGCISSTTDHGATDHSSHLSHLDSPLPSHRLVPSFRCPDWNCLLYTRLVLRVPRRIAPAGRRRRSK